MSSVPAEEYRARLQVRRESHTRLARLDLRYSYARFGVFLAAVATAVLAWKDMASWWFLLAPIGCFLVLIQLHDRAIRALEAVKRSITYYDRGLARIEDRWIGAGEPGMRFRDEHHPYSDDLDLFGRGSLFELLSTARTRGGEEALAAWLKHPAQPDEIRARQEAVTELTGAIDLRENLAVAGEDSRITVDTDSLRRWTDAPAKPIDTRLRFLTFVFAALAGSAILYLILTFDMRPLGILIGLQLLFLWYGHKQQEHILHDASKPARELEVLSCLLKHLEAHEFVSDRLASLRRSLATDGRPASRAIRKLQQLLEFHEWARSLPLFPVGMLLLGYVELAFATGSLVLLSNPFLAVAIEQWRRRFGVHVNEWLATVAEFEAFAALSAYRYEHPEDPFPEIVASGAMFDGVGLGHPLLPADHTVRNDVHLAGEMRLLLVSGSNMSGKSTLLRTVGINAVLALAGAPVRATSLRMSPLAIGATLRIQDSLQEGHSRFYAEVVRIRALADLAAGSTPLLFLLDELLQGTNSHDRLVGSTGILRSFLDHGAIGLVTTHDLALTAIADQLAPRAANVHFEDSFVNEEMRFDYRMKPGPVSRSNALALMRAVGLDVREP